MPRLTALAPLLFAALAARAQQPSAIPAHPLGPTLATTKEPLRSVYDVLQLTDGRVLVNDAVARRLLLFDSTLTTFTVVVDSTAATRRGYTGPGALIAYGGDTTLLFDSRAQSVLVIGPDGAIVRGQSLPVPADVGLLVNARPQMKYTDPSHRLLYEATMRECDRPKLVQANVGASGFSVGICPGQADTLAPIVRAGWGAAIPDTIAFARLFEPFYPAPNATGKPLRNPLPGGDDYVVTSDGWLALIRTHDYHVDWVGPDGSRVSSPKLPLDWHRLSDGEKAAIVDSARAHTVGFHMVAGKRVPDTAQVVPAATLPDYRPPFRVYTARADAEGNVWLLPTRTITADDGPTYDVVSRARGLIDRVSIPKGMTIVGFGRGVVYLTSRVATGTVLVRVRSR